MNELSVTSEESGVATDQSIWSILACVALFVLLMEWWFFQVRPGGFRVQRAG